MILPLVVSLAAGIAAQESWTYPKAETHHVDYYHGVAVPDPYRWLEDPDSEQTRRWVEAQNVLTQSYLSGVPQRAAIAQRIRTLWDFEKYGVPFREGGKFFWSYNTGLQNQSVYFVGDSLDDKGRVLIDPNTLRADGTAALSGLAVTEDAKFIAYGIADAGSDWNTWRVRDVATGQDLPDEIRWVKFSGASWTKDGKGFFYSRYDAPKAGQNSLTGGNYHHKLYFHQLGTPQEQDVLVYHEPSEEKKDWGFGGGVTEDGRYLIINVWKGTDPKNRVYYKDLSVGSIGDGQVVKVLDEMDASYDFVGNDGGVFYFKTDLSAPRGRVIAIDTASPDRANWRELIPQTDATIQGVSMVGNFFFVNALKDAHSQVSVHDLRGAKVRDVDLPGLGSAGGFGGKRTDTETFYAFSGFTTPGRIYRYDLATGRSTLFKQAQVAFNPDDYQTRQVFYNSKDGTRVPMFIVHKKGVALDGSNPTLLYGYGGFNISLTPSFSVSNLVWMEMGGVYAVANIRGGGEYGEEWHRAGTLTNKQNVFDDFIGAAEWLIANNYTSSRKLAIRGGSNGGLLVGACMTQRPELFGACLPEVGVLDMLRFHRFTIGHAWRSDYGAADRYPNESDPNNTFGTEEQFRALLAYSPLHNVRAGTCYPPTMIMTADHDDRVVPAHSFKFAAALQAAQGCSNPTLIRIETRAGHGAGKPTSKIIEEAADRWSFLVRALGMTPSLTDAGQPKPVAKGRVLAYRVDGMTCEVCVEQVKTALSGVAGVKSVDVVLAGKSARVELDEGARTSHESLVRSLKGTKFKLTKVE